MSIPKLMFVFGTRPEAIKMAPLVHKLTEKSSFFEIQVCVTGQHRQMLDQILKYFEIKPDFDLDIMIPGQDLIDVNANILCGLKSIFDGNRPDFVVVHGDTTTALAAAMAAFYLNIPVCHVEAGLRTFDIKSPFPEEFNRQTVSKIAKWHFSPTELSRENLLKENVNSENVVVTGNTVIDAMYWVLNKINADAVRRNMLNDALEKILNFDFQAEKFVLVTGHRRENFGDGFKNICEALVELSYKFPNVKFVYPVHLNPNVKGIVHKTMTGLNNVKLVEPLDYEVFIYLMSKCYFLLTDSGGVQEEAPSLGKPVLVMRNTTERPEAVQAGTVKLVGSDKSIIIEEVSRLINDYSFYSKMSSAGNPYGDGLASDRIALFLKNKIYNVN